LTKKRHDHVIRDIESIIKQLQTDETLNPNLGLDFKSVTYKDSTGKSNKCYELSYRAMTIVVTGYSVVARTRVIDRWIELESKQQEPVQYGLAELPDEETRLIYFNGAEVKQRGEWFMVSRLCRRNYHNAKDFVTQKRFQHLFKEHEPRKSSTETWVHKSAFLSLCYWLSKECGYWAEQLFPTPVQKVKTITLSEYIDHTSKLFGVSKKEVLAMM
jgi:phage regulator Rha-like protein